MRQTIDIDQSAVERQIRYYDFIGGNTDDVLRVALNKSGPKVRVIARKGIQGQVRLPAKYINDRMKFQRATRRKLSAVITTPSRGLLSSRFSTDSTVAKNQDKVSLLRAPPVPPRGIRVKIRPKGSPKTFKGKPGEIDGKPFYMLLPQSRAVAIVGRRATAGKRGGKIKVFYSPSLSQVFNSVREEITPDAQAVLSDELQDAVRFLLIKRGAS